MNPSSSGNHVKKANRFALALPALFLVAVAVYFTAISNDDGDAGGLTPSLDSSLETVEGEPANRDASRDLALEDGEPTEDEFTPRSPAPSTDNQSLVVRVLRSDGQPAVGVAVGVCHQVIDGPSGGSIHDYFAHPKLTTDKNGRVEFVRTPEFRAANRKNPRFEAQEVSIRVAGIFRDPPRYQLNPREELQTEIQLTLPPYGLVEVEVRDHLGQVIAPRRGIRLLPAGETFKNRWPEHLSSDADRKSSLGTFFPVGLDLPVEAQVGINEDQGLSSATVVGRSSKLPDGVTRLVLACTERVAVVTGRLIHSDGTPVANATWSGSELFQSKGGFHSFGVHGCRTDENGQFKKGVRSIDDTQISSSRNPNAKHRLRLMTSQSHLSTPSSPPLFAEFDVALRPDPGVTDIGEQTVEKLPLLVAGRIFDGNGQPAQNPKLSIECQSFPMIKMPGGNSLPASFSPLHIDKRWDAPTTPEGDFEIRGFLNQSKAPEGMRIRGTGEGFITAAVSFTLGQRGLTLEAEATGQIIGELDLPKEVFSYEARHCIHFSLTRVRTAAEGQSPRSRFPRDEAFSVEHDQEGKFQSQLLKSGTYSLRIFLYGEPISEHRQIEVRAGDSLDLGTIGPGLNLSRFELRVQDSKTKPIGKARVLLPGSNRTRRVRLDDDGSGHFYRTASTTKVLIKSRGFENLEQEIQAGASALTLTPLPRLLLKIANASDLLPPELDFVFELRRTPQSLSEDRKYPLVVTPCSDGYEAFPKSGGNFTLSLNVGLRVDPGIAPQFFENVRRDFARIHVRRQSEQVLEFQIDSELIPPIKKAVATLSKRYGL